MNKNFMPISIDISGHKILIIGGGQSAYKKLQLLQRFGADVEILTLRICPEIVESGVPFQLQAYHKSFLKGYLMLYSCTNDETLDLQILADAKEAGVLVNIHDNPALCQFVSPAIFKSGNITVAVASNATDVYQSIEIRNIVGDYLTENYFNKHNYDV
jgi:siroheme synthase-like protein